MQNTENIKKVNELIKDIRIAMLTTIDPDGQLRSRPMGTQETEFDGTIWFFTQIDSGKIESIQADQQVNVAYSSAGGSSYVSVSGTANVVLDPVKIKELWTPAMKAWFPEGPESEKIALLKIEADSAEYWEGPSSKVVQMIGFAKAILTGKQYSPGENKKVEIRH